MLGPFFWLGWPLRCRRENIYQEVVQVDDGIFLQREDDMIFMVRFQGEEISFRKYD